MTNAEIVLNFVSNNNRYCDDCLSEILRITPRQQINQICRKLSSSKTIMRETKQCVNCSKDKIVNTIE